MASGIARYPQGGTVPSGSELCSSPETHVEPLPWELSWADDSLSQEWTSGRRKLPGYRKPSSQMFHPRWGHSGVPLLWSLYSRAKSGPL